jgi:hypothetical protein
MDEIMSWLTTVCRKCWDAVKSLYEDSPRYYGEVVRGIRGLFFLLSDLIFWPAILNAICEATFGLAIGSAIYFDRIIELPYTMFGWLCIVKGYSLDVWYKLMIDSRWYLQLSLKREYERYSLLIIHRDLQRLRQAAMVPIHLLDEWIKELALQIESELEALAQVGASASSIGSHANDRLLALQRIQQSLQSEDRYEILPSTVSINDQVIHVHQSRLQQLSIELLEEKLKVLYLTRFPGQLPRETPEARSSRSVTPLKSDRVLTDDSTISTMIENLETIRMGREDPCRKKIAANSSNTDTQVQLGVPPNIDIHVPGLLAEAAGNPNPNPRPAVAAAVPADQPFATASIFISQRWQNYLNNIIGQESWRYLDKALVGIVMVLVVLIIPRWCGYALLSTLKLSSQMESQLLHLLLDYIHRTPSFFQPQHSFFSYNILPTNLFLQLQKESTAWTRSSELFTSVIIPPANSSISIASLMTMAPPQVSQQRSMSATAGIPIQELLTVNQRTAIITLVSYASSTIEIILGWYLIHILVICLLVLYGTYHYKTSVQVINIFIDEHTNLRTIFRSMHKTMLLVGLFGAILPLATGYIFLYGLLSTVFKSLMQETVQDYLVLDSFTLHYEVIPVLGYALGFELSAIVMDVIAVLTKVIHARHLSIFPSSITQRIINFSIFRHLDDYSAKDIVVEFTCWLALALIILLFCWILPLRFGYLLFGTSKAFVMMSGFEGGTVSQEVSRAMDILFLHVLWPLIFENISRESCIRQPLQSYLTTIFKLMQLESYMNDQPAVDSEVPAPSFSWMRIAVAGIMSGGGLFLIFASILNAPGIIGNLIIDKLGFPRANSICHLVLGFVVIWILGHTLRYMVQDYHRLPVRSFSDMKHYLMKWSQIIAKCLVVGVALLSIPPLLIGFLLEYWVLIPYFGTWHETPQISLFRTWVYGLSIFRFAVK